MVSVLWPIFIRCPVTGTMIIYYDKGYLLQKVDSKTHDNLRASYLPVRTNGQDLDKGIWWYIRVKRSSSTKNKKLLIAFR